MATKASKLLKETDNRSVYNKALKEIRAQHGVCQFCRYHRGCNKTGKFYAFTDETLENARDNSYYNRIPNWKLVSKNKKQWMDVKYKTRHKRYNYGQIEYYEIVI